MDEDPRGKICRFCKHELDVCCDEQKPASHLRIPITDVYCFKMFVPCGVRRGIEEYVHRIDPDAIPGEIKIWTPDFVTREGLRYEVIFEFGDAGSKITGGDWKKMLNDDAVRPGHIMHMTQDIGGFRGWGRPSFTPFFVAMCGLSRRKAKVIDKSIYARGIMLGYQEMKRMINSSFGPTNIPCCVFVHRMSKRDVTGGYMRIPKRVVERIEKKTGLLEEEGGLLLVNDADTHVNARYKKISDKRLVLHEGFRAYANLLGLEVGDVVAICFQKIIKCNAVKLWFTVIA